MILRSISFAAVLGAAACGGGKQADTTTATSEPEGNTLYDRLGKLDVIEAIVKDFVEEQVANDARIHARFFSNVDIAHLEQMLSEQICEATGGPCRYTGRSMKEVHAGLDIDDAAFTALIEDLKKSLVKFHVRSAEQDELIAALAKMRDDIVEKD